MKVLIVPEDQELDRYIVKPVVEALLQDLDVRARIEVLPEPRLHGAGDALDRELLARIIDENPMVDLFLLMVDRDCNREGNEDRAKARQTEHPGRLIACVAVQEIEVWLLALYKEQVDGAFAEIREHCDPKEQWAEPLLDALGSDGPGRGRKKAMRMLAGKWRSLRDTCPELRALQRSIQSWCDARGN